MIPVLRLAVAALLAPSFAAAVTVPDAATLASELVRSAPSADPDVIGLATRAFACARASGQASDAHRLSLIDYSKPSTQPRLWVFDVDHKTVLFNEWVAHGRNSGDNVATHFSNAPGSLMSSIGGYLTADTYVGHNGYSLRLRGLEAGFNDNALDRAIVMHGAAYVSPGIIRSQGRLGRSFGCPAVRPDIARQLIDTIRDGSFVFAYYPDQKWLHQSALLGDCGKQGLAADAIHPGAGLRRASVPSSRARERTAR